MKATSRGDFFRTAVASERDLGDKAVTLELVLIGHAAFDRGGSYAIDKDPATGNLQRQHSGESCERCLAGRIGTRARRGFPATQRTDVDDAPVALVEHEGHNSRLTMKAPVKFTSITRRQSATEVSTMSASWAAMPALLTRMSILSKAAMAWSTAALTEPSSVTSQWQ